MEFEAFEQKIISLCEADRFDEAEAEKQGMIPHIKVLLRNRHADAGKYLDLYAQLAGEAESFDNLLTLLEALVAEGLIDGSHAEELRAAAPANRWT